VFVEPRDFLKHYANVLTKRKLCISCEIQLFICHQLMFATYNELPCYPLRYFYIHVYASDFFSEDLKAVFTRSIVILMGSPFITCNCLNSCNLVVC